MNRQRTIVIIGNRDACCRCSHCHCCISTSAIYTRMCTNIYNNTEGSWCACHINVFVKCCWQILYIDFRIRRGGDRPVCHKDVKVCFICQQQVDNVSASGSLTSVSQNRVFVLLSILTNITFEECACIEGCGSGICCNITIHLHALVNSVIVDEICCSTCGGCLVVKLGACCNSTQRNHTSVLTGQSARRIVLRPTTVTHVAARGIIRERPTTECCTVRTHLVLTRQRIKCVEREWEIIVCRASPQVHHLRVERLPRYAIFSDKIASYIQGNHFCSGVNRQFGAYI